MPNKDLDIERPSERRLAWLLGKECTFCTEDAPDRLTILHRDPEQRLPGTVWGLSRPKREKVLKDAIVVCRGCRATRTGVAKNLRQRRGPRADAVQIT